MRRIAPWMMLVGCAALAACDSETGADPGTTPLDSDTDSTPVDDTGTGTDEGCQMVDILFIVDDSVTMGCEQDALAAAFPGLAKELNAYAEDKGIRYRIGVTSTGKSFDAQEVVAGLGKNPVHAVGLDGRLQRSMGALWIDGPAEVETLSLYFGAMTSLGTDGPPYEMPLECLRLALDKTAPGDVNAGFLRDGALFVAVLVTDEDDCSRLDNNFEIVNRNCLIEPDVSHLVDLEEYATLLKDRFGPKGFAFLAVAGQQKCGAAGYPTTCSEDADLKGAVGAARLQSFIADHLTPQGGHHALIDLCTNPLSEALDQVGAQIATACDAATL